MSPKSSRTSGCRAAAVPMTDQAKGMTRSNAGAGRRNQNRTPRVKMVVGQGSPNVGSDQHGWTSSVDVWRSVPDPDRTLLEIGMKECSFPPP
jgi:hypothetical protein